MSTERLDVTTGRRITVDENTENAEDDTPKLRHWRHPTDPTLYWCGKPTGKLGFSQAGRQSVVVDCPMCVDMQRRFPNPWWWKTHNAYYESQCHRHQEYAFHNCAAA